MARLMLNAMAPMPTKHNAIGKYRDRGTRANGKTSEKGALAFLSPYAKIAPLEMSVSSSISGNPGRPLAVRVPSIALTISWTRSRSPMSQIAWKKPGKGRATEVGLLTSTGDVSLRYFPRVSKRSPFDESLSCRSGSRSEVRLRSRRDLAPARP